MTRPTPLLPSREKLQELWETRAGRALRTVGLDSVRTTILTLAVLATLIPALAMSWISYRQNSRAIEAKLSEQLTASSRQGAREVGLWLKERLYDLRVFAASYEVSENLERRGAGTRRLSDYLNSVNERFPAFDALMVVTPDERMAAASGGGADRLNLTGNWMRGARQGEWVLGDPMRADSAAGVTMDMAVPIVHATGRFLGVFAARLNFSGIATPLQVFVAERDGRLVVVRPDGLVVVALGTAITEVPVTTLRRLERAEGHSVAYTAADGVAVLGVVDDVPQSDWKVIAEIPAATAYEDIRRLRNTTVLLVIGLLVVVGSLAYGLGLLIVLPLERLSGAAKLVAGGDLDVDVPVSGGGEVAQLAVVFNDMVRRVRDGRAELERLSVTDALTGLANRRHLASELERELQRSDRHKHSFAVLMLDVDRFKEFNDTHGHLAGDAVLQQLAQVLRDHAREVDTVARYGGEEFLVILPETTAAAAAPIAKRIRAGTEKHKFVIDDDGQTASVTVSIGYAVFPDHARTADALIEAADQALYRSKQAGRNRVTAAG